MTQANIKTTAPDANDRSMRVLINTVGTRGHFFPLVPLARALQRGGHDVIVATAPELADDVRDAGFAYVAVGPPEAQIEAELTSVFNEVQRLPVAERRPYVFSCRFAEIGAPRVLPDLLAVCQDWQPQLVIHDTAALAAPLAATLTGARPVHHGFGPLVPAAVVSAAATRIAALWRRAGVDARPDAGLFADTYVDICPPALQWSDVQAPDCRCMALRPEGYDGAARDDEPVDFGGGELPIVFVSLGTLSLFSRPETFRMLLDALADRPVRVVLSLGAAFDPASLGTLPRNAEAHRYVRQSFALDRCDVFVTHGGAGAVLAALRHGRPALVLPAGADQFDNAQALAACGAGSTIFPAEASADRVGEAISALLDDPRPRQAARMAADEIADMPFSVAVANALANLSSPDRSRAVRKRPTAGVTDPGKNVRR